MRAAVGLAILTMAAPMFAQQATIQGEVRDPSGAAIVGAEVKAINVNEQAVATAQTNEAGFFLISGLVPGLYTVDVQATGFAAEEQTGLHLEVEQVARVDFSLKLGAVSEKVDVSASPTPLNTDTSVVGQVVDNRTVVELPLSDRNYLQLAMLTAGTSPDFGSRTTSAGTFSAVGQSAYQVSVQLDGVDNSSRAGGGELGYQAQAVTPSVDAIQEFKVVTDNNSAEYGRRMGGMVIVQTKSGGNAYHGSAYEFIRNQVLDAANFFSVGEPKPKYEHNQFGGTFGGPIRHNHLFFFGSVESTRYNQGTSSITTVPTAAVRSGNFSGTKTIYDPATTVQDAKGTWTRTPFPGKQIPESRFDPVAANVIALYPLSNLSGLTVKNAGTTGNYYYSGPLVNDTIEYDGRLDYDPTPMQRFFVRFSRREYDNQTPGSLPMPADGGKAEDVNWVTNSVVGNWNYVLSPSMVNELRLGYIPTTSVIDVPWTQNYNALLGIKGIVDLGNSTERGMALFSPTGYAQVGAQAFWPNFNNLNIIQITDALTRVIGTHSIKFGIDLLREHQYRLAARYDRGHMAFNGSFSQDPNNRTGTGEGMADFLLGEASGGNYGDQQGESILSHNYAGYIQDNWRATSRLTVNLGVRWDRLGFPSFHSIPVSNFMFSYGSQTPQITVPANSSDCGCIQNNKDFAPRIGLAYQAGKDWVLHSGFGIFYGAANIADQDSARFKIQAPQFTEIAFQTDRLVSPALIVADGFPTVFPTNTIPQGVTVYMSPLSMPNQYAMEWFADAQRSLPEAFVVTASYIGVNTRQMPYSFDANTPLTPGPGAIATRRPWPYYGTIQEYPAGANASYNALTLKAEKRYTHSLTTLISYTWAHNLAIGTGQNGDATQTVRDPYNLSLDRGNADYDIRQNFVASAVYDLPFGHNRRWLRVNGPLDWVAGGWQMSGIFTDRTGRYFSPTISQDLLNMGTTNYPNRIGNGNLPSSQRTLNHWFDASAFVAPPQYVYGNSGRNILIGPGKVNLDFNLSKNFYYRERYRLQFRAEAFNLTNTPPFDLPTAGVLNPGAGQITAAGPARILQGALKLMF